MNEEEFSKLDIFSKYYDEMKPHMSEEYKEFIVELINNDIKINDTGISTMTGMGITVFKNKIEYCIEFRDSGRIIVTEVFDLDARIKVHKFNINELDYTEKILQLIS